jgi:hypothetical protein
MHTKNFIGQLIKLEAMKKSTSHRMDKHKGVKFTVVSKITQVNFYEDKEFILNR